MPPPVVMMPPELSALVVILEFLMVTVVPSLEEFSVVADPPQQNAVGSGCVRGDGDVVECQVRAARCEDAGIGAVEAGAGFISAFLYGCAFGNLLGCRVGVGCLAALSRWCLVGGSVRFVRRRLIGGIRAG